jgi:hypothetical protein
MSVTAKSTGRAKTEVAYGSDYYGWIQQNVRALRGGRIGDLDRANVAEELEDMGKERAAGTAQSARPPSGPSAQMVIQAPTTAYQRT